ncbi:hypothetical protein CDEST_08472 [Colletotrichum destructivum]|uniref:Uncharacterized protein n=1 Tax=Colletotrichum destructivum TaxID=34406 RepID=A0AAX4IKA4_9PEZI|nr:hypothetical protein CDEST_08472 [Colletotrichum destructivum]
MGRQVGHSKAREKPRHSFLVFPPYSHRGTNITWVLRYLLPLPPKTTAPTSILTANGRGPYSCRAHCGNYVDNIRSNSLTHTCIASHPSPRRVGTYYITALEQYLPLESAVIVSVYSCVAHWFMCARVCA